MLRWWICRPSPIHTYMDKDGVQVELLTGVCAGILRLSIKIGNQFSTDNLAMVSPIWIIPTEDPHIVISVQEWKIDPPRLACVCVRKAHFGQKVLRFLWTKKSPLEPETFAIWSPRRAEKYFFGVTCLSWIWCAAQFPHWKFASVEGLYKIPGINAMEPDPCVSDTLDAQK